MRRWLGTVLMLLVALPWAPAAICAVRCNRAMSSSPMDSMPKAMGMDASTAMASAFATACGMRSSACCHRTPAFHLQDPLSLRTTSPAVLLQLPEAVALILPAPALVAGSSATSAFPVLFGLSVFAASPPLPLRI